MKTHFFTTKDEVQAWLDKHQVENATILPDLTVNVAGNVNLSMKNLQTIPVKFNQVLGVFKCHSNQLTDLSFSPHTVGAFYVQRNQLKTLEGAPQKVVGSFYCSDNPLLSLKGAPKDCGSFYFDRTTIKSLEFSPLTVRGDFSGISNGLTTLEFVPSVIKGNLNLMNNDIEDLSFFPKEIQGVVCFRNNPRLNDLQEENRFTLFEKSHKELLRIKKEKIAFEHNIIMAPSNETHLHKI